MHRFLRSLGIKLKKLSLSAKMCLVIGTDISACIFAVWIALTLRLEILAPNLLYLAWGSALSAVIFIPILVFAGFYKRIVREFDASSIKIGVVAISLYTLMYSSAIVSLGPEGLPNSIGIIQPIVLSIAVLVARLAARMIIEEAEYKDPHKDHARSIVYGAGRTGSNVAKALRSNETVRIIGFIDDDERLWGRILRGLPIFPPNRLDTLIKDYQITDIFLAIPSATQIKRSLVLEFLNRHHLNVKEIPSIHDLAVKGLGIAKDSDIDITKLLPRDVVSPNISLLKQNITKKVVLITGAGGSIGTEICRQALTLNPETLVLLELSERALYEIKEELESLLASIDKQHRCTIIPILGSCADGNLINKTLSTFKPHTIYHAAAYKHVPLVEANLSEGTRNNVFGTLTIAKIAIDYNVQHFVLISTDKAVRPTNSMGASKRLAEICVLSLQAELVTKKQHHFSTLQVKTTTAERTRAETIFSIVRFGNVLASSGSVVPKFASQIRNGGPVTLTHPDITRFFMTIPEAAQLVIQASGMAKGGEVFILDMGKPIKIKTIAENMISARGLKVLDRLNPSGDIEIVITGLRPGEKLYEELLIAGRPQKTEHPKIFWSKESFIPWEDLKIRLEELESALDRYDTARIMDVLSSIVEEYTPAEPKVDWINNWSSDKA